MTDSNWAERQCADRRAYEEERLIAQVFEMFSLAMDDWDTSKAQIAKQLGTSRAHVTQLFGGQRNASLRTVAGIAWALNARISLALEPLREGEYIDLPAKIVNATSVQIDQTGAEKSAPSVSDVDDLAA